MRRIDRGLLAGVLTAAVVSNVSAQAPSPSRQGRTIGAPIASLPGAIWADRNNDGYVDGYVYSGQYYAGAPASEMRRPTTGVPAATGSSATDDYTIGRRLLDEGDNRAAAERLLSFYRNNSSDARAPASLLYLGQALTRMGQPETACKSYSELERTFGSAAAQRFDYELTQAKAAANCTASQGEAATAAVAPPVPAGEIQAPASVTAYRDGHLSIVGDENRYGFTNVVPNQLYTVVLLACSPAPDLAMSAARLLSRNQPRSGYYLSTLSLQTSKSEVWYRLRPTSKEDVGQPFTIALVKGAGVSEFDLSALRPICPAAALTPQEIRRRFGPLADMDHKSLIIADGKEVFDFDWIVPGRSMIEYRRDYGEKYTNSAGVLLSWDERRQKLHTQFISAGVIKEEYFTPAVKTANVIPYEDDRRRAKIARADSGGSGGGFGGFLKGALAGAAGMAMGASPETATESMIAGAVAGGLLGANGEDAGMIGSAAAAGSAAGTAEVEASNAELRRISEQGLGSASATTRASHERRAEDGADDRSGEAATPSSNQQDAGPAQWAFCYVAHRPSGRAFISRVAQYPNAMWVPSLDHNKGAFADFLSSEYNLPRDQLAYAACDGAETRERIDVRASDMKNGLAREFDVAQVDWAPEFFGY